MKNFKVSFDYDGTLQLPRIQQLAELLIMAGADVWIVTARFSDDVIDDGKWIGHLGQNYDIRTVAKRLGIPREKIIFTHGYLKVNVYQSEKFDMHFDDQIEEIEAINSVGGYAVLVDGRVPTLTEDIEHWHYMNNKIK